MKAAVVISLDLPAPGTIADVLTHLDPPTIPHFAQEVRIVVGDTVDELVAWLEEGDRS